MDTQVTVRIPVELDHQLRKMAKQLSLKRSDVIRIALQQFLSDADHKETKPYERVKGLIGSIESGIPDLGEKHREHLIRRIRKDA